MSRIILTQIPEYQITFDPQLLSFLPMNRRAKIGRYRRANDKALCFAAGLAVIRSCMDMCDASPSDITLITEDNHAPYVVHKGEKIFASISHSDRYAAVITDTLPCGIDIEHKNIDLNAMRSAVNFFHFNCNIGL